MEIREFIKGYNRMCNSYGDNCSNCPMEHCIPIEQFTENEINIVKKWIAEHPITTNRMKFKEVFGVEPVVDGRLICSPNKICDNTCFECSQWWDEEYKEPEENNND